MAATQIIWFRQDLRLGDQAAVAAAAAAGPVLALYVLDDESAGLRPMGAASRWWLHGSLDALDAALRARGGALLLRRGPSARVLGELIAETGAQAVHALRHSEPWWRGIEKEVPGLQLHEGTTLVPPGLLTTKAGRRFRVFTPYWRAHVAHGAPPRPRPAPAAIDFAPLPAGERLAAWALRPTAPDWAVGFAGATPGEAGAEAALRAFVPKLADYGRARDFPGEPGTSRLSAHLHFGEISPARCWHAAVDAAGADASPWTRQLVWRDFAHETLDQFPESATAPHRPEYDRMPWTDAARGEGRQQLEAWQRGLTGYPLVDASMRQLWATGWMHNRVRMVAASFLAKHLMIDWREGERWFWDTLVDADLANNAMGWQWVMGSGVDSSPYYRIFSPEGQAAKFDADGYIRRWVPELASAPGPLGAPYPEGSDGYPAPIVDHATARARALAAHATLRG